MDTTSSRGKEIKVPGPDHPIAIMPVESVVRVTVAGKIVAESTQALKLEEKGYPAVYYLPRNDADMSLLLRTTRPTLSDSKTAFWLSIGTYCRTKPHGKNPSADFPCLATISLRDPSIFKPA
jgi:uncharacterized protein (DUF427 family)